MVTNIFIQIYMIFKTFLKSMKLNHKSFPIKGIRRYF